MHPKFLSFIFPSGFCPNFLIYFLLPVSPFSPFPIFPLFHFSPSFPSFSPFPFSLLFLSIPSFPFYPLFSSFPFFLFFFFPFFLFSFFPFFLFSFHPFTPVFSSDLLVYGCKRVLYNSARTYHLHPVCTELAYIHIQEDRWKEQG